MLKDTDGRTFNSFVEGRENVTKQLTLTQGSRKFIIRTQRVRKQCKVVENKRLWFIYGSTGRALHPDSTWVQSKKCATLLSPGPRPILMMRVHSKHTPCSANSRLEPAMVTTPSWRCEHNWPFPVMLPLLMSLVASFQHFALVQAQDIECSKIYVSINSIWAQGSWLVLASSMNQKSKHHSWARTREQGFSLCGQSPGGNGMFT